MMMMMLMMLFLSSLSSLSSSREVVEPYCYITSQHLIHSRFPPHRRFLTPGVAAVLAKKMDGVSDLCGIGISFGAIRLQVHLLIYSLKQIANECWRIQQDGLSFKVVFCEAQWGWRVQCAHNVSTATRRFINLLGQNLAKTLQSKRSILTAKKESLPNPLVA